MYVCCSSRNSSHARRVSSANLVCNDVDIVCTNCGFL
jgi:hypothetical protein